MTAALLWLAFWAGGFVPFGNNTPAVTDAKLQYLDLFAYYRDVLTGQNTAAYTFSNTLGGGAVAIIAYYLASPFNLLVLLFPKEQMNLFLEVLITVKLSAASAAFAWFIGRRFRNRIRGEITLVLSVSYGLMQYTLAQGSNVMWLDGVILLPFIVLGVHKTVRASVALWAPGERRTPGTPGTSQERRTPGDRRTPEMAGAPQTPEGRSALLSLAIPAALSVIANWYTGGINYLFSFVWLVYEAARGQAAGKRAKIAAGSRSKARGFHHALIRYLAGMGLGLLLASFLFVPNVLALRLGKGAAWNPAASWDAGSGGGIPSIGAMSAGIAPAGFRGNPFSVLRSYRIGEISDSGRASFFCGSLALFGAAAFFCSGRIRKRGKAAGAGLLLFTVMSVFWQPLFVLFSLFQYSNSYWYRYGYLGSFVLLYLAAYWAGSLSDNADTVSGRAAERRQAGVILRAGAISIFLILLSQRILPSGGMRSTRIAVLVLAGITALLLVPRRSTGTSAGSRRAERTQTAGTSAGSRREKRKPANSSRPEGRPAAGAAATAAALALAVLCIGEMFLQTRAMLGIYHTDTAEEYAAYSRQEQRQIEGLLSFDKDGFYRVNQTSTRIGNKDGLTAAYLDAMAYGYASVSGYTSCPENIQLEFLDRIGYRKEYESFNIVNTSFLPADSLLGVRYVLSGYGIPGLREVKELGVYNGKAVFENPFVLPVAMIVEEGAAQVSAEKGQDPFAYLEQIYGELSGQEAGLFVPAAAERSYNAGKTEWTIAVPDGNYCLYGNLPWREAVEGRLMVSEDQGYGYGGWLSPSVFYIPVPEEEAGASGESKTVRVTLETRGEPKLYEEQFYALDLDRLSEISALIRVRSANVRDLDIRNGAISCTADAAEGQFLILSVPASKGWTAFVNGKKTPIDTYKGCLIKIPLAQGENHITMQYRVPGMAAGIVMSLAGLAACAAMVFAGGRRGI